MSDISLRWLDIMIVVIAAARWHKRTLPPPTIHSIRLRNISCRSMQVFLCYFRCSICIWAFLQKRRAAVSCIRSFLRSLPIAKRLLLHARRHHRRVGCARRYLLSMALSRRHSVARAIHAINKAEIGARIAGGSLSSQPQSSHPFVVTKDRLYQLECDTLQVHSVTSVRSRGIEEGATLTFCEALDDPSGIATENGVMLFGTKRCVAKSFCQEYLWKRNYENWLKYANSFRIYKAQLANQHEEKVRQQRSVTYSANMPFCKRKQRKGSTLR